MQFFFIKELLFESTPKFHFNLFCVLHSPLPHGGGLFRAQIPVENWCRHCPTGKHEIVPQNKQLLPPCNRLKNRTCIVIYFVFCSNPFLTPSTSSLSGAPTQNCYLSCKENGSWNLFAFILILAGYDNGLRHILIVLLHYHTLTIILKYIAQVIFPIGNPSKLFIRIFNFSFKIYSNEHLATKIWCSQK